MIHRITVWGFLLAGGLGIISGLRDIFAPGFLNISPQVRGPADIVMQFVAATVFLSLAIFASKGGFDRRLRKK